MREQRWQIKGDRVGGVGEASIRIERESLSVEYRERRVGVMGGCSSY